MTPRLGGPLPTGDAKADAVRRLFDTISPRYDLVNRVMTFGMDAGWRRRTVRELRLPVRDGGADGAVCGFALRNVVSLPALFAELRRVVRTGGRIALLDASRPDNRVLRAGHGLYFEHAVPLIGALLSNGAAYAYLPRSMAYLPPPEEMLGMLREAGYPDARRFQLSGGLTQLLVGTRS